MGKNHFFYQMVLGFGQMPRLNAELARFRDPSTRSPYHDGVWDNWKYIKLINLESSFHQKNYHFHSRKRKSASYFNSLNIAPLTNLRRCLWHRLSNLNTCSSFSLELFLFITADFNLSAGRECAESKNTHPEEMVRIALGSWLFEFSICPQKLHCRLKFSSWTAEPYT